MRKRGRWGSIHRAKRTNKRSSVLAMCFAESVGRKVRSIYRTRRQQRVKLNVKGERPAFRAACTIYPRMML